MHLMRVRSVGTHLKNFDAMPCDGSSLLAKEMVYLFQVRVDCSIVFLVCPERLGWRESQEDRHSIVHDGLCVRMRWVIWGEERQQWRAIAAVDKLSRVLVGDDDDDGGQARLPS